MHKLDSIDGAVGVDSPTANIVLKLERNALVGAHESIRMKSMPLQVFTRHPEAAHLLVRLAHPLDVALVAHAGHAETLHHGGYDRLGGAAGVRFGGLMRLAHLQAVAGEAAGEFTPKNVDHGLEGHDLLGHIRGDDRVDAARAGALQQALAVAAGGAHDKVQPVSLIKLGIDVHRRRMGVVHADERGVLAEDVGHAGVPLGRLDQLHGQRGGRTVAAFGGHLQSVVRSGHARSGERVRHQRVSAPQYRRGHLGGHVARQSVAHHRDRFFRRCRPKQKGGRGRSLGAGRQGTETSPYRPSGKSLWSAETVWKCVPTGARLSTQTPVWRGGNKLE
eukprot:ctg_841.g394